jgi:hypothetical protein
MRAPSWSWRPLKGSLCGFGQRQLAADLSLCAILVDYQDYH